MLGKKIKENSDILSLMLILVAKVCYMPYLIGWEQPGRVMLLNAGLVMVLTSLGYLFSGRLRKGYIILLDLVCSLLLFADVVYYRYFKIPLTVYACMQVYNLEGLGESIFALMEGRDLLLFADFLLLPVFLCRWKEPVRRSRSLLVLQLVMGLLLSYAYPLQSLYIEKAELFRRFDTAQTFKSFGPLGFHAVDTFHYFRDQHTVLTADLEEMILAWFSTKDQEMQQSPSSQYAGVSANKNLILIQVESLQNFVIGKQVAGQEITPNLNKLLKNSLYFPHFYPQTVDGNSSDAELIVNASLYPLRVGSTFFRFPGNSYNSLANILKEKGYYSVAIHGDAASYWNRHAAYPNLGFNEYWDISKFQIIEEVGMGVSDEEMFSQSAQMLKELPRPFYAFIITLTSHYPYYLPAEKQYLQLPESLAGTHLGNYLQAVRYADEALGSFLKELKDNGLWQDSLIVIYGDHDGLFERDKPELERLWAQRAISEEEWIREYVPVPLLIHQAGLKGKTFNVYGGQVDVLPTLATLLDIEGEKTKFAMGKDLLRTKNGYAILPKGDYIPQAAFITPSVLERKLDSQKEQVLEIADLIIRTNFFQKHSSL